MIDYIELNNKRQCVSIKAAKKGLPLLIYLHGGPGDAALPLVSKYNKALEDHFTVVVWEQRGAGKSYYPFTAGDNICIQNYIEDLYALCRCVLDRYEQEKLFLVGHSWGSVLGLRFAMLYPQFLCQYVGCGQVVNMVKSSETARQYALQKNAELGNHKIAKRLEDINCKYTGERWLNDLLFVTGQVVKHGGSLYGKHNYNQLIANFLFSREYTLADLIKRQKGSYQSIQFLWQELMEVNFEGITHFDTPVTFVEGRHDFHVSSMLAHAYYESITTPKDFIWFEESAHFPQWTEAEKFNHLLSTFCLEPSQEPKE